MIQIYFEFQGIFKLYIYIQNFVVIIKYIKEKSGPPLSLLLQHFVVEHNC